MRDINWLQTIIGIILIIGMAFFAKHLTTKEGDMPLFLVTGLMLAYVLTRSRFGFAGGVKRLYMTGEGSLTRALLVMFGITMIGFAVIHYSAAKEGAVVAFRAAEGDMIIPGSAITMLLAGRFKINYDFKFTEVFYYALGGLLMGAGIYSLLNLTTGLAYSPSEAVKLDWALGQRVLSNLGKKGFIFLIIGLIAAVTSGINGFILSSSKLMGGIARHNLLLTFTSAKFPSSIR